VSQRPCVTFKLRLEGEGVVCTGTKWPPGLGGSTAEPPERGALIWPSGLAPCGIGKGPKIKRTKIMMATMKHIRAMEELRWWGEFR
jgi:hypothetical protein